MSVRVIREIGDRRDRYMDSYARELCNAISDVIDNRPLPIRGVDQIFMKAGDLIEQAMLIGRVFRDKSVVFIGDGDAVGLATMHLGHCGLIEQFPSTICVLDFDERVVRSIERFAEKSGMREQIYTTLYNIKDPLPGNIQRAFDGFYTNPPYGAYNKGDSVQAFMERGIEATGDKSAIGLIVAADDDDLPWTQEVLHTIQNAANSSGFYVSQQQKAQHSYHLDDEPGLTSCNCVIERTRPRATGDYQSIPIDPSRFENFYGHGKHLHIQYIRAIPDLNEGRAVDGTYRLELVGRENHERHR